MSRSESSVGDPSAHVIGPYDSGRDTGSKRFASACYAPSVSMYFDQFGKVRACCQNTGGLLGDVATQSIREIWESVSANRLRDALAVRDFSVGCGFCAWQAEAVGFSEFARGFDDLDPDSIAPQWPLRMEFSMTNSCNLQCVMCNGDWSSSIRAHRERRQPLPEVYGDRFFEELAEFLPHLTEARFLGGEPFLGREPLRVLEMLAALDEPLPRVSITTNGTQWSPRIEAICERLPISFVVSLDGITKETYESIRVGADFDVVMRNLVRFRDYARRYGTSVSIAHCLMTSNYHEFMDLLVFAEHFGLDHVGVNTVVFPAHLSLYQLEASDLEVVIRDMTIRQEGVAHELERFRSVCDEQTASLRARLDAAGNHSGQRVLDPWNPVPTMQVELPLIDQSRLSPGMVDDFDVEVVALRCLVGADVDSIGEVMRPIVEVDECFEEVLGVSAMDVLGQPISVLPEVLSARFGGFVDVPVVEETGIRAELENDAGNRYDVVAEFIDEGLTLRIVISIAPCARAQRPTGRHG